MGDRRKYAVMDGPYWEGKGEISLFWGDQDGNHIEDIPWPTNWPEIVDTAFLKQHGYIVETA